MKALRLLPLLLFLVGPALALPRLGEDGEDGEAAEIQRRAEFFYKRRALPDGTFAPEARVRALSALSGIGVSSLQMRRRITPLGSIAIPYPWEEIGPKPATEPGGAGGYGFVKASGRVNSIAVHPTDPDTVYIGGAFAGVAKSTDGGVNWAYLTAAMPSQAVSSVVIDPVVSSTVYAGTGDPYYSGNGKSLLGIGVYRSTDSGVTWGLISGSNDLGGGVVRALAIDSATAGSQTSTHLYAAVSNAGTGSGVYRSDNSGSTWSHVYSLNDPCFDVLVDPTSRRVYALCAAGGVTWADATAAANSMSWTTNDQSNPSQDKGRLAIAVGNPSTIYAAFSSGSYPNTIFAFDNPAAQGQLYKTVVGGGWTEIQAAHGFCDSQCFYDIYVGVDPTDANHIFLGGVDASSSTNGGLSFTDYAPFNPPNMIIHSDHHAIAFAPSNHLVIYEGNDGGMYRSTDGGMTWSNLNQNLSGNQVIGIGVSGDGRVIAGFQDNGGLMYSSGTSTAWAMVGGGDGGFNKIDPSNSSKYYYTYVVAGPISAGLLSRTIDDNTTVADITPAATIGNETAEFYPPLFMAPSNTDRLLFGGQHVYRTVNGGASWTRIGPLTAPQSLDVVSALVEAPSNPAVVYAAVDGSYGSGNHGVFVTKNATSGNAATWSPAPNFNFPASGLPNGQVPTAIAVHPTLSSTAYVTYSQYGTTGSPDHHIYKTVNYGATWTFSDTGLPDVPFNDILIDPSVPTHIFAASDVGVFASQDSGATWARSDVGMPKGMIANALSLHAGTRELVVGSYGMGAYRLTLDPAPPLVPTGLAATAEGVSSVTWSWDLVASATGYLFYPSTGGAAIPVVGTSLTLTDLSTNTAYGGRVSAANIGGEGPLAATATGYTLAAPPAGSAFDNVGVTSATIHWDDQGNPAGTIYEIGKWKVGVSTTVQTSTLTAVTATGLASNATYYFRIRAKNAAGKFTDPDAFLSALTLRPPPSVAPSGFLATSLDSSTVLFSWKPVVGATGYAFYPATGSVLQLATTGVWLTVASTGAAAGGRVAATANGGHGPLTATVTGYASAATPENTATTGVFISSASLTWDSPGNPAGTKFKVEWYKWATPASIVSKISTVTYATITGLTPNTSYYARVRSLNAKLVPSDPDASVTVLTRPLRPASAPAVLAAPTAASPIAGLAIGTVTWSWKPIAGAQAYGFQPSTGGVEIVTISTSVTLDGLASNTAYGAKVRAFNVTGTGPLSATVTGYTLADTPSGSAATVAISSVSLTWNAGGNPPAVLYRVEYQKEGATLWTIATSTPGAAYPAESKVIGGLTANTTYFFRVRSLNAKLVPGIPDATVTAKTRHADGALSVAAAPTWNWSVPAYSPAPVASGSSAALAKVVAFPNPLPAGQPGVNFIYLPAGAAIRVSNAAGALVRSYASAAGGSWTWDTADAHGRKVPAGIYAAEIESGGARRVIDVDVRR